MDACHWLKGSEIAVLREGFRTRSLSNQFNV